MYVAILITVTLFTPMIRWMRLVRIGSLLVRVVFSVFFVASITVVGVQLVVIIVVVVSVTSIIRARVVCTIISSARPTSSFLSRTSVVTAATAPATAFSALPAALTHDGEKAQCKEAGQYISRRHRASCEQHTPVLTLTKTCRLSASLRLKLLPHQLQGYGRTLKWPR